MKLPRDHVFEQQRVRFGLCFECDECAHFDAQGNACVHGYPTLEHREQHDQQGRRLVVFCKEFDLA